MENHIFEIVFGLINLLVIVIGCLIKNEVSGMHETIKTLVPRELCDEKHKNNAFEHESLRKEDEKNSQIVRDLETRVIG